MWRRVGARPSPPTNRGFRLRGRDEDPAILVTRVSMANSPHSELLRLNGFHSEAL